MKKHWPSWLKWGVIGLIIGLIQPFILLYGDKLFGESVQSLILNFSIILVTPIQLISEFIPITLIIDIIPVAILATVPIPDVFLIAPIFYMIIGMLFGLIVGKIRKRKHKKITTATFWTSEANIAGLLGDQITGNQVMGSNYIQNSFPVSFPAEEINVRVYKDTDESLAAYKTFDFDYINKTNPLLEKELFRQLKKELQTHGLTRATKDPQITISMDFFIGKKEQYTPPSTVTSTELKYDWNIASFGGNWGGFSSTVPITSSHTTPGYTTTTYYSNIRLNFLNHAKLVKSAKLETPPLIWIGEADNEGLNSDIREIASAMFSELVGEFPNQSAKPPRRYVQHFLYGGLGLGFDVNNWSIINYIEASSIAAEHGIKPGDTLMLINGKRVGNWPSYSHWYANDASRYRSKDPYFQYILSNRGDSDVELLIRSAETGKRITLKMRPRNIDRYVQVSLSNSFQKIAKGNVLGGIIGLMIVIAVTLYFIYFIF